MTRYTALILAFSLAACAANFGSGGPVPGSRTQLSGRVSPATNCPKLSGGTGLLTDGDFSQAVQPPSTLGFNKGQSFAPAWHVSKNTIDFVSSTYWNMDGLCSVDIDGGNSGAIAHKSFATSAGAKYAVTFFLSGNGDGGPAVKTLKVSAAGQSSTFTWDTSGGNDPRHGKFAKKTWSFTASKTKTTLNFTSLDPTSAYGAVIAAISLKKK